MLEITIPGIELFDNETQEFSNTRSYTFVIEHSLVSLSKWESKWHKPFLAKDQRSFEESVDYVRCMTLTQNIPEDIYKNITDEVMRQVIAYIDDPMTATWFNDRRKGGRQRGEVTTAEIIYYWMVALNIPFECQKWHLNRLMTLIQVCNIKNEDPKKMSKKDMLNQNRELNEKRKAAAQTKG